MPSLDISYAQPSFQDHCYCTRLQLCANGKRTNDFLFQYKRASFWKSSHSLNLGKLKLHPGHCKKLHHKLLVKAIASLEPKCSFESENGENGSEVSPSFSVTVSPTVHIKSSGADSEEMDVKEKIRRMRISKAITGRTPWNKGKKHSRETIQRIKERTKIAMQNPKVKRKLARMGWSQSDETKEKIGIGVRICWKKRRERQAFQEFCLFDWQNLIAKAAKKGSFGEEELQWDSYEIFKKQLQQEWLDIIEYRKTIPRPPKISKRAPKSLEQRRKIAEAIAAKWADPEYRASVRSGLARYYGTPEEGEGKAKRKPSGKRRTIKPYNKKVSDSETNEQQKLKKQYVPMFKDPLANSKLEMLKNVRAQRAASEMKKNETLERAKILVAEAQKAAEALEFIAMRSRVVQASLVEARKLIAEATQTIERIEKTHEASSRYPTKHVQKNGNAIAKEPEHPKGVNSMGSLQSSLDFDLSKVTKLNKMDKNGHLLKGVSEDSDVNNLINGSSKETVSDKPVDKLRLPRLMEGYHHLYPELNGRGAETVRKTKKWVCGRLLEVIEGE